jgi:MFS family permease
VNLSLSTIRDELHASIDSVQWIISGYLLSLALALPLNAWMVERLEPGGSIYGASPGLHWHRFFAGCKRASKDSSWPE